MLGIQYLPCGTRGRSRGPFSVTFDSSFSTERGWNLPWECWRLSEPREMFFISCSLLEKTFFFSLPGCVFVQHRAGSREKRENGISGKKQEQLLAEKHPPTSDFELENSGRGKKNRWIISKNAEFTSTAPKFPTWWGKQPQTELSATEKIKILASPFPFCPRGSVCFTRRIEKKWIVVLNRGWKGTGFRGNVGRLWTWVVCQCFTIKLRGKGIRESFL